MLYSKFSLNVFDEIRFLLESYKYKSTESKNNLLNDDNYIITHVSNFRKVKRIQDVIKIFDKISKELDAKLLMIGDGPERSKAERLCKKLGIKGKVIFFGNSNEPNEILLQRYADITTCANQNKRQRFLERNSIMVVVNT